MMSETDYQLATFEGRPFFELALRYGVQHGLISRDKLDALGVDAAKGMVQIATAFGSPYLRAEIDLARIRMINLVSLYLADQSGTDLDAAARLIRDNTLLGLSRGGSTMLKQLFALPEYPILGTHDQGRVEDFLEFWSRKKSSDDYHKALRERQQYQAEIRLATQLAGTLGLSTTLFKEQHCEADSLIRSALLTLMAKKPAGKKAATTAPLCFDMTGFATLLAALRKKGVEKLTRPVLPAGEFSDAQQQLLLALQADIVSHDLPKIGDPAIELEQLVRELKGRYFIRDSDMEDTASFDALVSKEWTRQTGGKTDIDAIFTLLLGIAAGVPGKTNLTEAATKTLIKKIREDGFHPELAVAFIKQHAPHEKQQGLLEDWQDFCEQAQLYLLDDWDHGMVLALRFLRENCYIQASSKAGSKKRLS